jgi:hypothetical protein
MTAGIHFIGVNHSIRPIAEPFVYYEGFSLTLSLIVWINQIYFMGIDGIDDVPGTDSGLLIGFNTDFNRSFYS